MTEAPSGSVERELGAAREALRAAEVLLDAGIPAHAVSRAYYAMFHAASALLASIGRTTKTHDGLRAILGEHFVRPGLLDAKFARRLAHAAGDRNDADYNVSVPFSHEDALEDVTSAREFLHAVEKILVPKS